MMFIRRYNVCFLVILMFFHVESSENFEEINNEIDGNARSLTEEGRTMVHHAVKRMMIILPAVFFKLGIAFTLLIIVTLASITNGFIGFLLLVVGLSSVLARLQESRRAPLPYFAPHPHGLFFDRSDRFSTEKNNYNFGTVGTVPYYKYAK